jgi:NADH-quinone oxidoreductase subunit M
VDRLVARFQAAEQRLGQGPQVGTVVPAVAARLTVPFQLPTQIQAPLPAPTNVPPGGAH